MDLLLGTRDMVFAQVGPIGVYNSHTSCAAASLNLEVDVARILLSQQYFEKVYTNTGVAEWYLPAHPTIGMKGPVLNYLQQKTI
ncbi:hypothetical protein RvY_02569 [Ramazzottius varieornatus]|uniref:Uncharacterized protein n=1 Tax=Ramazzottius varieornatus TaxID=947166 RepID=A0A1D1UNJ7_RAMVA|nr:hypothetical protein RvY_02569 [Ramazzottius varieornatus]